MRSSTYIPLSIRQLIAERAKSRCEYCQLQQELCPDTFEIDHIIPRMLGGKTELNNLCYACPVCNNAKRSQILAPDPQTGRRVRLFDPRRQRWSRHFRWGTDSGRILGLTAIGRATVVALDMNRPRMVHIRLLWAALGLHPPHS
jgi:hypothetical protein